MNKILLVLKIVWASPASLLGLTIGLAAMLSGGRANRKGRVLEFHGGAATAFCRRMPIVGGAAAVTLGHMILGVDADALDFCRPHEMVHVRQYERWGPLFLPTYFVCSLVAWLNGQNPYYDNRFEREAYRIAS